MGTAFKEMLDEIVSETMKKSRNKLLADICDWVQSEEFITLWLKADGKRFGEFVAEAIREKFYEC